MSALYHLTIREQEFSECIPLELMLIKKISTPDLATIKITLPTGLDIKNTLQKTLHCCIADSKSKQYYNGTIVSAVFQPGQPFDIAQLTIRPKLHQLSYDRLFRWYDRQTPVDLISSLLQQHGITHEWKIKQKLYLKERFVQYGESTLNFIHRILARYGFYYRYIHLSNATHIVITDTITHNDQSPAQSSPIQSSTTEMATAQVIDSISYNKNQPDTPLHQTIQAGQPILNLRQSIHHNLCEDPRVFQTLQQIDTHTINPSQMSTLHTRHHGLSLGDLTGPNKEHVIVAIQHTYQFASPQASSAQKKIIPYQNRIDTVSNRSRQYHAQNHTTPRAIGLQLVTTKAYCEGETQHAHQVTRVNFLWDRHTDVQVRRAQSHAGDNHGFCLPLADSSVSVIQCMLENPNSPVVIGQLYTQKKLSPFAQCSSWSNGIRLTYSNSSKQTTQHGITFHDGKDEVAFTIHSGNDITERCQEHRKQADRGS